MRPAAIGIAVFLSAMIALQSGALLPPIEAELDKPVELAAGRRAIVRSAATTIEFTRVVEDSRCPVRVQCVWEGDAAIEATMTTARGKESIVLHTSRRFERAIQVDRLKILLEDLKPQPETDRAIAPRDYRATFLITLAPPGAGETIR